MAEAAIGAQEAFFNIRRVSGKVLIRTIASKIRGFERSLRNGKGLEHRMMSYRREVAPQVDYLPEVSALLAPTRDRSQTRGSFRV